jgi:hypothetical protein
MPEGASSVVSARMWDGEQERGWTRQQSAAWQQSNHAVREQGGSPGEGIFTHLFDDGLRESLAHDDAISNSNLAAARLPGGEDWAE